MKQPRFMAFNSFGPGNSRVAVAASVVLHLLVLILFLTTPLMKDIIRPRIISVTFHSLTETAVQRQATVPVSLLQHKRITPRNDRTSFEQTRKDIGNSQPEALLEKNDIPIREDAPAAEQSTLTINRQTAGVPANEKVDSLAGVSETGVITDVPAQGHAKEQTFEGRFGERGAPTFIHREIPVYPELARRLGKEGRVLLKLQIDADGKLMNVEVIETAGFGFTEASVDAVRKSTYSPGLHNGIRVAMRVLLPVSFRLQ